MGKNKIISNLNKVLGSSPLKVYDRVNDFSLAQVCTSLIYSGRVLLVINNQNDLAVNSAEKILLENNFKVTRFLFEGATDNADDLAKMFDTPEDVRLVITLNSELIIPTLYYATLNNLPAVICVQDFRGLRAFSAKAFIKNGERLDRVMLTNRRHIIIDEQICSVKNFLSEAFAEIESKTLALIDYRLKDKALNSGINLRAYSIIRRSILETFSIFAHSKKAQKQVLLENLLKIYIADFIAEGEVFLGNSIDNTLLLFGAEKTGGSKLLSQKIILGLLEILFSGEHENILDIPDYLIRSKFLSTKTKINELEFYDHFSKTHGLLDKIDRTEFKKLYNEVCSLKNSTDRMVNIFIALGGNVKTEKSELAKAIKYAGDFPYSVNGVTYLRESGIAEYL